MIDHEYPLAYKRATEIANRLNTDVGLMKNLLGGWCVFALPQTENRRGHELNCQVVSPSDKKSELGESEPPPLGGGWGGTRVGPCSSKSFEKAAFGIGKGEPD